MKIEIFNEIKNLDDLNKIAEYLTKIRVVLSSDESVQYDNGRVMLKNFIYANMIHRANKILKHYPKINLKNFLKRNLIHGRALWKLLKLYPNVNRDLGQVPKVFLYNVDNKEECSKKIFELFAKYSLILNYNFIDSPNVIQFKCSTDELEKELSQLINKNVKISMLGYGNIGNTFKISIYNNGKENQFVYKVFFPRKEKKRTHGTIEVIFSYYSNIYGRKNQFVKFLMGRFATPYYHDAFMLINYVVPKAIYTQNPALYINYLFCKENHEGNSIDGKIIDVGGMEELNPVLKDKALNKLVRIITSHINFYSNPELVQYRWYMSRKSSRDLKKYIDKVDENFYKIAVDTIKDTAKLIPDNIIKDLKNIKNWDDKHTFNIEKNLKTEDIITIDINKLYKTIDSFQLTVGLNNEPYDNFDGVLVVNLLGNKNILYMYNKEKEIKQIRIEKLVDDKFITLLELHGEQINEYQNPDISALLTSLK